MWDLNFILNFMCSNFTFYKYSSKFYLKTLCPNISSNVSSKIGPFLFPDFFYRFCHMSFIFVQTFYTDLLYLNIFVQVDLICYEFFLCIYFVYDFIFE